MMRLLDMQGSTNADFHHFLLLLLNRGHGWLISNETVYRRWI